MAWRTILRIAGLGVLCVMPCGSWAQTTVIRAARMLDVTAGVIRQPGVVIIDGPMIRAVAPSTSPQNARTIDLGDATLLPGLIDSHIHLQDEPGANWVTQRVYETTALMTLRAARSARRALLNGFTTVRDLGSTGFVDVALSKAVVNGWI